MTMNQIKTFNLKYSYDIEVDSIHIKTDDYTYYESLELEEAIILDFSDEWIPVALEILDIAELFSVEWIVLTILKILILQLPLLMWAFLQAFWLIFQININYFPNALSNNI